MTRPTPEERRLIAITNAALAAHENQQTRESNSALSNAEWDLNEYRISMKRLENIKNGQTDTYPDLRIPTESQTIVICLAFILALVYVVGSCSMNTAVSKALTVKEVSK